MTKNHLQTLKVSDLLKIMADASHDPYKTYRLKQIYLFEISSKFYVNHEAGEYLLPMSPQLEREQGDPYFFFTQNHAFEIHRVSNPFECTNDYSFINFPNEFEAQRTFIQERFREAVIQSGEFTRWNREKSWDELTEQEQLEYNPNFVEDNKMARI